jgi:8-oxo-dGTP diphosphatase
MKSQNLEIIHSMVCCVIDPLGRVLLLKRSPNKKHFPNKWAIVGAAPLTGEENMKDIAKREMVDEIGSEGEILKTGSVTERITGNTKWIVYPFLARLKDNNVVLNEEHTEYKWVDAKDVSKYKLSIALEAIITQLLAN